MLLFNHTISDSAVSFLTHFTSHLDKELKFAPLPHDYPHWGAADVLNNEFYVVGFKPNIPDVAFEATLCHEVYHAYQFAHGFPFVMHDHKDTEVYIEHLRSNILDLSADDAVREYGLDDSLVMKRRYRQLKDLSRTNFSECQTPFGKDLLAINLILDFHSITANQKALILQKLKAILPDVYDQYHLYQEKVDEYGYRTPHGCFNIFGFIIENIKLWPYCHITYNGKRINDLQSFTEMSASGE